MTDEPEETVDTPVEGIRFVDKDRMQITFLIDELLRRVDLDNIRPVAACNGCNGCS